MLAQRNDGKVGWALIFSLRDVCPKVVLLANSYPTGADSSTFHSLALPDIYETLAVTIDCVHIPTDSFVPHSSGGDEAY